MFFFFIILFLKVKKFFHLLVWTFLNWTEFKGVKIFSSYFGHFGVKVLFVSFKVKIHKLTIQHREHTLHLKVMIAIVFSYKEKDEEKISPVNTHTHGFVKRMMMLSDDEGKIIIIIKE